MKFRNNIAMICFALTAVFSAPVSQALEENGVVNDFIGRMVKEHQFDENKLRQLFRSVEIKDTILSAIASPAEAMDWYQYRKIFMTDARIDGGVAFWKENEAVLRAVEQEYGVAAEIIIAIIGVETRYGAHVGSYRVIDALSTLAFAYPKRSAFFSRELENFLILTRDEQFDPLTLTGSYAGAMGIPQFMPSSFRAYAADYEKDNKHDIWGNKADAIASVANYLAKHNWQKGAAVAMPVSADGTNYRQLLTQGLHPDKTVAELRAAGVRIPESLDKNEKVKLLALTQEQSTELWLAFHNFYVITRYNRSPLYAMAVYQLSQAISERKNDES